MKQIYLKDFNDNQPDKLLETRIVRLTPEQEAYLNVYMDMDKPQLFRTFKRRFNSDINKLQFNFALERVRESERETKIPPSKLMCHPRPDVPKEQNVYWVAQQGIWAVKFKVQGKTKCVIRSMDFDYAVQVAKEYRQNSA